jgi:iron complex outermembrane receptor protein
MKHLSTGLFIFVASALNPANAADAVSENDFIGEMPVVLSVTRLAQPLHEAPGAVTVIDRDIIRRSGARELAEILRLVPGFIVTHKEGGALPFATYHAEFDDIARHLDVYVDGRSVYSSLFRGSASFGMMGIVIEDIERIEVLRGSNSASYGANAFLGVVNIVTRHTADTVGQMLSMSMGESALGDGVARFGWGDTKATHRITVGTRNDDGFENLADNKRLKQVSYRGDLEIGAKDNVRLIGGHAGFSWDGYDGPVLKNQNWRNTYGAAEWVHGLAENSEFKLGMSFDEERFINFFPGLRADGVSRRQSLEGTHSLAAGHNWRFIWGGQYRTEEVHSPDLFFSSKGERFNVRRVFGHAEWRIHPQWLINFGGLWERHSIIGDNSAPRAMVNFHIVPGHTVRLGSSKAYKLPTLFELRADWAGQLPVSVFQSTGKLHAEYIKSTEFGYLGQIKPLNMTIDVRAFEEKVKSLIGESGGDLVNEDPNTQRGWETQLRWQPAAETQVLLNHTVLRLIPDVGSQADLRLRAPRHYSTLALFQRLPRGFDVSIIHTRSQSYFVVRKNDFIPEYRQTDVRLARSFKVGAKKVEAALFIRAIDGDHIDYALDRGRPTELLANLGRRIHATVSIEF